MSKSLQYGLYELCRQRIEQDAKFRAQSMHRNFTNVDDALFDEYRLWQLKKTVRLTQENSPFYHRLFADFGVDADDIHQLSDLARFPFTVPADLKTGYNLLCTSQSQVEKPVTFYSSGSTGLKKRIFFSMADIQKILDFLPRGMNTVIDREEGRIQVFLQNSQGRGIGGILAQSLNLFGMQGWTSDLQDSVKQIAQLMLDNHVNVWFGEAITILRATRILSQQMDLSRIGMKCIFITMTNIPDSMIRYLENTWGCKVSTHYGLTESGWGLAVDCDCCSGYHYNELDHMIEIVDPDTGALLPYGEQGEVVLTNISRECMPLVRYRTGDIATLYPSSCGSHLDLLGHIVRRKEGAYLLNGKELYPALFDETLFQNEQVLDYRIYADDTMLFFDLEVLKPEEFDGSQMREQLGQIPVMQGETLPEIRVLPCGTLRSFAFEKKKILPFTEREKVLL